MYLLPGVQGLYTGSIRDSRGCRSLYTYPCRGVWTNTQHGPTRTGERVRCARICSGSVVRSRRKPAAAQLSTTAQRHSSDQQAIYSNTWYQFSTPCCRRVCDGWKKRCMSLFVYKLKKRHGRREVLDVDLGRKNTHTGHGYVPTLNFALIRVWAPPEDLRQHTS